MNQQEFIAQLERALRQLPAAEVRDIVTEYQGYFAEAIANGRSEAEFCAALGSPFKLAEEILAQSAVPALAEEQIQGFETDEKSGLSWILHSWRVFKLAPVLLMGICVITAGVDLLIEKIPDHGLLSNYRGAIFSALIVAMAWRLETKRKLDFSSGDREFAWVVIRILGLATLMAVLGFLHVAISDQISGRPISMAFGPVFGGAIHGVELWFTFIWIAVELLMMFAGVLIVLQKQPLIAATKLSVKASLLYWRQILAMYLWIMAGVIILLLLGLMCVKIYEAVTGDVVPSEMLKTHFLLSFISWGAAILCLLPYSAWAAIFRDGTMRTEVRHS
ncbi:DUF1700 domain-containing protein [Chitinibacter tainanensis]|uniref:DUF1700 domain-containing protein n=1 Tax=Chitinibacter tainanensis TaxID=230667 RepID=UPI0004114841|nr:DUF1700 domain-containing protein [Chitinibacter tainanensis]